MNNKKGKILAFLASDGKEYEFRIEAIDKKETKKEHESLLVSQTLEMMNHYLKLNNEASARNLKIQEMQKYYLKEDILFMKSSKWSLTLLDTLNDYMLHKKSSSFDYPESEKQFLKVPKTEINKCINKRMKEIIPETVFKDYILDKSPTYDEYISFRKVFAYQYGAVVACNFILSADAHLHNYLFDLKTGNIEINEFKLNYAPKSVSEFSVRLSRNIMNFFTKVHVNANVLPAFVATIAALSN